MMIIIICQIVCFAVPVDHRVKIKENEKRRCQRNKKSYGT